MDNKLKYHLTDRVPAHETILYAMQHMVYFAAGTVVLPIAVGIALGLNQVEMATFLQRTFILCGITTLIQLRWGHTYPIIDGPAGLWASIMIVMSSAAADMGSSAEKLCTDLEMGAIIAGVVVMIIAATGFINTLSKLFTPIVNGVVITLMVLQMSSTFLRGILGLTSENSKI
ncbi:MAG: purine/pyrimidine permease, partial [Bacillota bacterium]|nr:purine/pyrimidine permease [Bacillota bacterium]